MVRFGERTVAMDTLPMGRFLLDRQGEPAPPTVANHGRWSLTRRSRLPQLARPAVVERLASVGITSPASLAAMAITRQDPTPLAEQLGITVGQVVNLMHQGLAWLPEDKRAALVAEVSKEHATGLLNPDSAEYQDLFRAERLADLRRVDADEVTPAPWAPTALIPRSVDHRPLLGPARDQNPRGTCYAFGAAAVREFHENARAGGAQRIDLSEEYIIWHRKRGALFTIDGDDGVATLKHLATSGACLERDWPYVKADWAYNTAHVPTPDDVRAKASVYRGGSVVRLPSADVMAARAAIAKGKVVVFGGASTGVMTATGECRFPGPTEDFRINHAMVLVGYVDSDAVPDTWGGGYFIVRNSHGDRAGLNNVMGPEYGGHVRMPYSYYENHTALAGTFSDDELVGAEAKQWVAEYFTNRDLEGTPWLSTTASQIAFEWGYEGPLSDFLQSLVGPWLPGSATEDHFSARWTTTRYFDAGWYWFETLADDGIRVLVDDRLIINEWHAQPATKASRDHYVQAGMHVVTVEYFERTGTATARFSYGPRNWWGYVYPTADASGAPTHTLEVSEPAYEWRHLPPVDTPGDRFSVKVEGFVDVQDGSELRFHALATGGIRIAVDDVVVFDALASPSGPYLSNPISVKAGVRKISVVFSNRATRPVAGDGRIFLSGFRVGWFTDGWDITVYHDPRRHELRDRPSQDQRPDHDYQTLHGMGLSGTPLTTVVLPTLQLPGDDFTARLGLPDDATWISLLAHRGFVSSGRRHRFRLIASRGFALIVDGRALLDNIHGLAVGTYDAEVELAPGVHDLVVAYYGAGWGAHLMLDDVTTSMWTATWWPNEDLSGPPAATTKVDRIDFDWGWGGPGIPGIGTDHFSASFDTEVHLRRGRYRFVVRADDGVRLYVDRRLVVDSWFAPRSTSETVEAVEVDLQGGPVPLRLEYVDRTRDARVQLDYAAVSYLGAYYRSSRNLGRDVTNTNVTPPILYRYEPALDFDWGLAPPDPRVGRDTFSVRWTGLIDLPVGRYWVRTTSDDGVRLLLDGKLVIDRWQNQAATQQSRMLDLVGREHEVTLEYYDHASLAECRLTFDRVL